MKKIPQNKKTKKNNCLSCAASGEVYVVLEPATSFDLITFTDPFAESFGHAALRYQKKKLVYKGTHYKVREATKLPLSKICEISVNYQEISTTFGSCFSLFGIFQNHTAKKLRFMYS
jgi:hypothetical protein